MKEVLRSPVTIAGGVVVLLLVGVAIFAPLITPYEPSELAGDSLQPPTGRHLCSCAAATT